MPTPVRRDGVQRREELLDAALVCFAKKGVLATGIEDIRRSAGASPSSVYHLFGGIADVTVALLIRTFDRLFRHLAVRVTAERTAKGAVTALVDGHLEWIFAHRKEGSFMYQAMSLELAAAGKASLARAKAAQLEPIVTHLDAFAASGKLPAWPPLALDVVLLGPAHEACRRALAGAPLDPAWLRATLPRLAWQSIARERP